MKVRLMLSALLVLGLPACGVDHVGLVAEADTPTYCDAVRDLSTALDEGVAEYHVALEQVVDRSPEHHLSMWQLLASLSRSFDYEIFNPAADAFDQIAPELDRECNLDFLMIINDAGRIERYE